MKKVKRGSAADVVKEVIAEVSPSMDESPFTSPKTSPMLPPESWERVFQDYHSTDFLSVINSAPEWNHLLSSRKTAELFENVLPFVMKFLPKKDFLTTRLVSRAWKRGTDNVYESHSSRLASVSSELEFPKLHPTGRMLPTVDFGITFQTRESFQRFTTSMKSDCGNPFPGRCVRLMVQRENTVIYDEEEDEINNDQRDNPEYWSSLELLLTKFGEQIWYLDLHYLFEDGFEPEVESRLRRILQLVPNLRKLSLYFDLELGEFNDDGWTEFNDRLVQYFTANPPSKLEKLELFSFTDEECGILSRAGHQLLKSYCEGGFLKRLRLIDMLYDTPVPLPELVELETSMHYKALPKLKEASPKLEKLTSYFHFEQRNDYDGEEDSYESFVDDVEFYGSNIFTLFDRLRLFGGTLKELNMENVYNINCNKRREYYKVQLPKLESLTMEFSLPVSHLFELKSLKFLILYGSPVFEKKADGDELFEHLPKLERIVRHRNGNRRVIVRPKML